MSNEDTTPRVPVGVIEGIEQVADGKAASKEDLEEALGLE